jgi:hypothetical protein
MSASHTPGSYRSAWPNPDGTGSQRSGPKLPHGNTLVKMNTTKDRRSLIPSVALKPSTRESPKCSTTGLALTSPATAAVKAPVADRRVLLPPAAPQSAAVESSVKSANPRRRERKVEEKANVVKRLQQFFALMPILRACIASLSRLAKGERDAPLF